MSRLHVECNLSHPSKRNPYFKPLESQTVRIKTGFQSRAQYAQHFGPRSSTKRNDGKADIMLKYDGKAFKAHKDVMREASELFAMIPAFQRTKQPNRLFKSRKPCEYDLTAANLLPKDCKPEVLDKVIEFAYTGHLPNFPAKDSMEFFTIAVALHFHEACTAYFKQFNHIFKSPFWHQIVSTKVGARLISLSQKIRVSEKESKCAEKLENLFEGACGYLLKNPLDELIGDKDFLKNMTADGMEAFLDVDDLAEPHDERKVLNLALAWLKYDAKNREQYALKLLQKIHLGLLPQERLVALSTEMKSVECKQLIEKVLQLMDSKEEVTVPLEYSHYEWFGSRKEMWCDALIAFNPGAQGMTYFDPYGLKKSEGWYRSCDYQAIINPPLKRPTYKFSALSINDKVYLAGGCQKKKMNKMDLTSGRLVRGWKFWNTRMVFEGNVGVRHTWQEDKEDYYYLHFVNSWCSYPPMITGRKAFPMVHYDGYLYAIGGEDNESDAMKEAERYSFEDKKWEKIADLPIPCYYACATVYKGNILVYGSQPVPNAKTAAQHDLQMYDTVTNKWTVLLTEHHIIAKYKEVEDWEETDDDDEEEDGSDQVDEKAQVQNSSDKSDGKAKEKDTSNSNANNGEKGKSTECEGKDDGNVNANNNIQTKDKADRDGKGDADRVTDKNSAVKTKDVGSDENGNDCAEKSEKTKKGDGDNSRCHQAKSRVLTQTATSGNVDGNKSENVDGNKVTEKSFQSAESAMKDTDDGTATAEVDKVTKSNKIVSSNSKDMDSSQTDEEIKNNNTVKESDAKVKTDEGLKKDDTKKVNTCNTVSLIKDYDSDQDLDWSDGGSYWLPENALVIQGDDCFRVVYTAINPGYFYYDSLKPVVNRLKFDLTGSHPSAKVGKSENQKLIPETDDEGTFQIRNQVYVNLSGCVLNTGIRIAPKQKKTVSLGPIWDSLYRIEDYTCQNDTDLQFVNFKFNKKAMLCKNCIRGLVCENLKKKKKHNSDCDSCDSDNEQ